MHRHPSVAVLSSELLQHGNIFDVLEESVRLPSGLEQHLLLVDHPGAVCIAPILSDGDLLLVRQYRHAIGDWMIEIPAGRLERNEDPLTAAKRELEEETGHRARKWNELRAFHPAPGFSSERIHLFEARELEPIPGGGRECDPDEELELLRMSPREILAGTMTDAKTLLAAALVMEPPPSP